MIAYYTHSLHFVFFTYQCILESVPDYQIKAALFFLLEKQFLSRQQMVALPGAAGPSLEPRWQAASGPPDRSAPVSQECQVWYLHLLPTGWGHSEAQEAGMCLVDKWRQQVQRKPDWKTEICSRYEVVFCLMFTGLHKSTRSRKLPQTSPAFGLSSASKIDGLLQGWCNNLATNSPPSPSHGPFLLLFLTFPS